MKVFVIGGGAGGMMAALSAAEDPANTVTVLERQNRVGRKLLATGNGRCNLTNLNAAPDRYHGADPAFVSQALRRFDVERTLAYFKDLGLYTTSEDDGKVYPLSDQANSVVDTMRFALEARGVTVIGSSDVVRVAKKARGYQITTTEDSYFADKLIVAAGGCAGKRLGGSKSGYAILQSLGHTCTELYPSLVQIKTDPTYVRAVKGVRADAVLTLKCGGRAIAQSVGEVQFTDFGVSGPVAFELSRAVSCGDVDMVLLLDFMRAYEQAALEASLRQKVERFPALTLEHFLTGMLNSRLGGVIVKFSGLDLHRTAKSLSESEITKIAHNLKFFPLTVEGVLGMEHAQVTAGGVPTSEFRADTLESRLCAGVFACGEVLDIDGDCGGFNLQWAWSSGYVAGKLGKTEERV